jgi:hypothetical protein
VITHDPTLSPQVGAYGQDTGDGGDAGAPGQADQDVLTTGVVQDAGRGRAVEQRPLFDYFERATPALLAAVAEIQARA